MVNSFVCIHTHL